MPTLTQNLPTDRQLDADEALLLFIDWTAAQGFTLYPAQEQAILEIFADHHVILATPTGSGKSLVGVAAHFFALTRGQRSFYTSPIKALVSEKFFALCHAFGADNVGLMTGDATVNRDADIICCTAEILAQLALHEGEKADVSVAVVDEFHYYADRDRGMAWQIPLLMLPHTQFLLMSATLGDTSAIAERLQQRTQREVVKVESNQRPVPLHFSYNETPIHETIASLLTENKAPIYLVHFAQRAAGEQALALMSMELCTKDEKKALANALQGAKFDSPFGKDIQRLLRHGVGLHHAGLLPKYRLLVEQLAQQGLLKVICGTDTLGVGINVPLRTVVLSQLCKYDGEHSRLVSVREFLQIAGRAGRKGFDDAGWVVAQAPEHVIYNKRMELKQDKTGKTKQFVRAKPPEFGYVAWNKDTFEKLVNGQPEPLQSVFALDQGMILALLHRARAGEAGVEVLCELIGRSHEQPQAQLQLRREFAYLFRALVRAGLVQLEARADRRGRKALAAEGLQRDFSLHHTLSLWLVDGLLRLEPTSETHSLDSVSLVEAILENPTVVLKAQLNKAKTKLINELKADGVPFEERQEILQELTWPKPLAEWIYLTFEAFSEHHPWVSQEAIRPKSIVREMAQLYCSFDEYIKEYNLAQSEGVLLRYLSQAYKTLVQNVPVECKTEEILEIIGYLRAVLARVDSSLLQEWERLRGGDVQAIVLPEMPVRPPDPTRDRKTWIARLRAEMHRLVKALIDGDFAEAALSIRQDPGSGINNFQGKLLIPDPWTADQLAAMWADLQSDVGQIAWNHQARAADKTQVREVEKQKWQVVQTLLTVDGEDSEVRVTAEVDLADVALDLGGVILSLVSVG